MIRIEAYCEEKNDMNDLFYRTIYGNILSDNSDDSYPVIRTYRIDKCKSIMFYYPYADSSYVDIFDLVNGKLEYTVTFILNETSAQDKFVNKFIWDEK